MTLVLEIEYLLGVSFAARIPANSEPDWPPQPDRIYSALVAAWGARGERSDERAALEWLEAQNLPELAVSEGFARTAAIAYVPPNDPQTGRVGDRAVIPALRRRYPRRFPAYRPNDPIVRLIWSEAEADGGILTALNALAVDTPYIGHSASVTRCRFWTDCVLAATTSPRNRIYPGRLAELERNHHAGRRPNAGESVHLVERAKAEPPRGVFSARWLVLEHPQRDAGTMPDLRAAALVGKALRDTLMSGYARIGLGDKIPAAVSGHTTEGGPLAGPHLAIVPLAFLGGQHADGRVLGFALVPPGNGELLDDADFQRALKAVAPWNPEWDRRELALAGRGFTLTLALSGDSARQSLDPAPYVTTA
ncbi:MAG: CRISPR-associated protein Csb2, partial [Gammaproteobacteria bacterium]|nr:CRISPR-associated protein Csb2 [Gammaproteobacteria bacterium]